MELHSGKIKLSATMIMLLFILLLTACGGDKTADGTLAEEIGETVPDSEQKSRAKIASSGYGLVEVSEAPYGESPLYGIMHASIIEINGSTSDKSVFYTLVDEADPDNIWSLTGLEIGYIGMDEIEAGDDVAVFFNGDIINDCENVEFLVIAPEGQYEITKIQGRTTSNIMNSFTVESGGTEHVFIKDNCRMDDRTLVSDSGERVIVYYARGAEDNYPLRVFSGEGRPGQ